MRFLIRLYPRAWRERYGVEFEELLRQESMGLSAVLNIVATAFRLRALDFFGELHTARVDAISTFQGLPPLSRFALIMAGMSALLGWAESRFNPAEGALLVSTATVIVIKLLSRTANESDAFKSRVALILLLVPAITSNFWEANAGLHPILKTGFRPSLMGLILALSVIEPPLPARDALALLRVGTWVCILQAASFPAAAVLGLVSWRKAVVFGVPWALFAIFQHRQRATLTASSRPPALQCTGSPYRSGTTNGIPWPRLRSGTPPRNRRP